MAFVRNASSQEHRFVSARVEFTAGAFSRNCCDECAKRHVKFDGECACFSFLFFF